MPVHGGTLLQRVALVQVNDGEKRASDCRLGACGSGKCRILRPMRERSNGNGKEILDTDELRT